MFSLETPASCPPVVVRVQDLKKSYRHDTSTLEVLNGISLEIKEGEFIAIMGASGSGKSTLLHALGGLTGIDSGVIAVEGVEISDPQLKDAMLTEFRRKRIGIIFQAYNLMPTLNVWENVLLPIRIERKVTVSDEERALSLLRVLKLEERKLHLPSKLSGGEQQRVAIARSLITQPALILADEPTGNLDSQTSLEICRQFKELCSTYQKTLVLVTHEATSAIFADRTIILKDGCIQTIIENGTLTNSSELALAYQKAVLS